MKMPSVMGHKFSEVPRAEIQRAQFDRSFGYKTTFDAGLLIPFYCDEALPGDTFVLKMSGFARMATPLKPIMDNMFMETFFFFVPTRLIWNNWQKFQGEQEDPGDSTDFEIPVVVIGGGGAAIHSLWDYFGIPTGINDFQVDALHSRAYNLIYNEWFRDQNLQNSLVVDKDDGPDLYTDYVVRRRGKRHDYFTSSLPWPQKGDAVALPLTGNAPIVGPVVGTLVSIGDASGVGGPFRLRPDAGASNDIEVHSASGIAVNVFADLSAVTAATINELRQAFQIQKILERDARGGTRYVEAIKARFGVTSPDARLQRPEYLGGGSSPVTISPVAQTSEDGTTPQANLAAIGTASFSGHGFTKSFTEHGVLIGMVCVRADLTYQQGSPRMFHRRTRFDFFEPALAHLGEQVVRNREIYAQGTAADDDAFGYQERFAEYRYKPSQITGLFRSTAAGTLDVWHLSQEFSALPELDSAFIVEDPPIDRVIATPTEPHFLFDSFTTLKCARPMPLFGVPGLIDHF